MNIKALVEKGFGKGTNDLMRSSLHKCGTLRIQMPLVPPIHFSARKIGLFGGSFNPPHHGHVLAANEVMRRLRLDQVWLLITPGNPLKSHKGLASSQTRLTAAQKIIYNYRMKVLTVEQDLGTVFTAALLSYLRSRYPATKFFWIMGGDNFANFHLWHYWEYIAEQIPLVVVDRPGWRFKALSSPAGQRLRKFRLKEEYCRRLTVRRAPGWVFLSNKLVSTSSTQLRGEPEIQFRKAAVLELS